MTIHHLPSTTARAPSRAILTEIRPGLSELDLYGPWADDQLDAAEALLKAALKLLRDSRGSGPGASK